MEPGRARNLEKIYNQPSLPREVRGGIDPEIGNSIFFFFVKGGSYQTRISAGPSNSDEPYRITATGNMFQLGTPAVEMSFSKDGTLLSFKEKAIISPDSKQENILVPSNLKHNRDIAEKVADQIIGDILQKSRPVHSQAKHR